MEDQHHWFDKARGDIQLDRSIGLVVLGRGPSGPQMIEQGARDIECLGKQEGEAVAEHRLVEKGANPAKAIAEIKKMMVKRVV